MTAVPDVVLTGVSCPTTGRCLAVGFGTNAAGTTIVPVSYQSSGGRWQLLDVPTGPVALLGVACPAWNRCVAVGADQGGPEALRWNGTRWRTVTLAKVPAGIVAILDSVACSSPWRCAAAGVAVSSSSFRPYAEQLTGRGWTPQRFMSAVGLATGVSCPTSTSCDLVGLALSTTGSDVHPFLADTTGGSWNREYGPSADAALDDVACTAAGHCLAVGASVVGQNGFDTFAEALTGSTWSEEATVPVTDPARSLLGVSCPSATWCVAGGGSLIEQRS